MPRKINEVKDFLCKARPSIWVLCKQRRIPLNIKFQIRYSVLHYTLLVQHKEKADEVNLRHQVCKRHSVYTTLCSNLVFLQYTMLIYRPIRSIMESIVMKMFGVQSQKKCNVRQAYSRSEGDEFNKSRPSSDLPQLNQIAN